MYRSNAAMVICFVAVCLVLFLSGFGVAIDDKKSGKVNFFRAFYNLSRQQVRVDLFQPAGSKTKQRNLGGGAQVLLCNNSNVIVHQYSYKNMASLEEQSLQLISALFVSIGNEEDDERLEERGGGQSRPAATPGPNPNQQELLSRLLSHIPRQTDLLNNSVPPHLPDNLKVNIPEVTYQPLAELYDIDTASLLVARGDASIIDIVSSYLHSFRNIYEYELSDQGVFHSRFLKYFSRLFSEMVEQLCSDKMGGKPLVSLISRKYHIIIQFAYL